NGAKWYQLDVHKWIIYLMSLCGLAWDLKRTPQVRVEAKVSQTMEQFINSRKKQLELLYTEAMVLVSKVQSKTSEIEQNSSKIRSKVMDSLRSLSKNLTIITQQLSEHMKNFDDSSEQIINIF